MSPTSGSPIAVVVIPTTGDVTATGLDGGVSSDEDRARKVALELRGRTGGVQRREVQPAIPFGGHKRSGQARENGYQAISEYLEVKSPKP